MLFARKQRRRRPAPPASLWYRQLLAAQRLARQPPRALSKRIKLPTILCASGRLHGLVELRWLEVINTRVKRAASLKYRFQLFSAKARLDWAGQYSRIGIAQMQACPEQIGYDCIKWRFMW
jgi:hypothetical protein